MWVRCPKGVSLSQWGARAQWLSGGPPLLGAPLIKQWVVFTREKAAVLIISNTVVFLQRSRSVIDEVKDVHCHSYLCPGHDNVSLDQNKYFLSYSRT